MGGFKKKLGFGCCYIYNTSA